MSIKFGIAVQIEDIKSINDDWRIDGYASTFGNPDEGNDIVAPGSFDQTLVERQRRAFLHSHDMRMVLGRPKMLKPDKKGLFGQFHISKTTLGTDARQLAIDGAMDALSIGYAARDYEIVENGRYRLLKDLDLFEVSLVALPMNGQAEVTAVKDYLSLLGITADMTHAEKAHAIGDGLKQLLSDLSDVAQAGPRPLNQSKRQELKELLETLSGLDDARSNIVRILEAAPMTSRVSAKRTLYELNERRARLAPVLKEI